ncbi:tellurite resistance TerB family protein [Acidihalobacter prosperus]
MLGSIKEFLKERLVQESRPVERGQALRVATAAILLEVSRADFETDEAELEVIAAALREAFDLGEDAVREIIAEAREQDDEELSLYPFLRIVNDACAPEEKYRIVCDLWRVAYADGRLDKYEEYQIRRIADLLYVAHPDFIRAKLAVQGEG